MKAMILSNATAVTSSRWWQRISRDNLILGVTLTALLLFMWLFILMPLWAMLVKSVQNRAGEYVGLANFATYFSSNALWQSMGNTFTVGVLVTVVVSTLAFGYAYALSRSCMPMKGLFQVLGSAPILAPSLLPAISLIFLFGNQGIFKSWLGGESVYGLMGISLGLIFWTFPHALMILNTSLRTSDARLYEAARALKTPGWKTFLVVTLPAAKYG
ncbi:ABC transporter permease subunit, partial [Vibrio fluvialis]|nr:ABC transporter permease subunit [Vibrio fluvialis]